MRRTGASVIAGLAVVAPASCGSSGEAEDASEIEDGDRSSGGNASVVVTTNILGDVAGNVLGDQADVEVLMPRNADPHSFGISANQAAAMTDADLVIANGLGLEEGLEANLEAARDAGVSVIEVAPELDPIPFTHDDDGEVGVPDPHVWTDPDRMMDGVDYIATEVAEHVPDVDEETLGDNASAYRDELEEVTATIEVDLEGLPDDRRKLVTNHHVFGYFAERFDFEVVGAVLPSGTTLASPSAADLAGLADTIRHAGVPAIFADSSQSGELADALAREVDLDVEVVSLFTESLGEEGSGAETYLEMVSTNSDEIVEALGE